MPSDVQTKRRSDVDQQARPAELERVTIEYHDGVRWVMCFCGSKERRSIVPHLKTAHPRKWHNWTATFIELRSLGYPLKRIMRLFSARGGLLLFSWTVIERAIRKAVESDDAEYSPPPTHTIDNWQPQEFSLEKTTLWDFPRRGRWAVHSSDYRGNWPPQIPRNLILRYTRRGDLVVDAFVGGGTTLIEAWLLGRRSVGLDISKLAIQTTAAKIREMENLAAHDPHVSINKTYRPEVIEGDALDLARLLANHTTSHRKVKLLCAHPPYLDSLPYTTDHARDLSLIHDAPEFTKKMRTFAKEVRKVLSSRGVCAVLIGDVRKRAALYHLAFTRLTHLPVKLFK